MWPMVQVATKKDPSNKIDGELFDEALRLDLLAASPLDDPIFMERSADPEISPDIEVTHKIKLTDAGRRALAEASTSSPNKS